MGRGGLRGAATGPPQATSGIPRPPPRSTRNPVRQPAFSRAPAPRRAPRRYRSSAAAAASGTATSVRPIPRMRVLHCCIVQRVDFAFVSGNPMPSTV